nr:LysR family transcriptional regulator [uncultured Sellimonas sp.]
MNKYQTILSVCETHSISKTASLLNYTQSAVSQAIKNFEKELGVELFIRSKNGMELKPDMTEIIKSLRVICEEEKHIFSIAASLTNLDSGFIRVGTIQSISYHWLPGIIKEFSALYPNIRFQVTIGGFDELKAKLHANELDCIFVSGFSVPEFPFFPLGNDELMLVTPIGHPLSEHLSVSLSSINNYDFILSSDGLDYETGKIFELNHISPHVRYQLNEDFATLKMVEQGFGITILPKLLLKDAPFQVCVRSFTEHYSRTLGIAFPSGSTLSHAVLKFRNFSREWSKKNLHD